MTKGDKQLQFKNLQGATTYTILKQEDSNRNMCKRKEQNNLCKESNQQEINVNIILKKHLKCLEI